MLWLPGNPSSPLPSPSVLHCHLLLLVSCLGLWSVLFFLNYFNWRIIALYYCDGFLPYISMNRPRVCMCTPILNHIYASSNGKECACNVGDLGLIPRSERSPGEGHGNPLQYSCLDNSMDRGARWATVHGVAKSWTQLSD